MTATEISQLLQHYNDLNTILQGFSTLFTQQCAELQELRDNIQHLNTTINLGFAHLDERLDRVEQAVTHRPVRDALRRARLALLRILGLRVAPVVQSAKEDKGRPFPALVEQEPELEAQNVTM